MFINIYILVQVWKENILHSQAENTFTNEQADDELPTHAGYYS